MSDREALRKTIEKLVFDARQSERAACSLRIEYEATYEERHKTSPVFVAGMRHAARELQRDPRNDDHRQNDGGKLTHMCRSCATSLGVHEELMIGGGELRMCPFCLNAYIGSTWVTVGEPGDLRQVMMRSQDETVTVWLDRCWPVAFGIAAARLAASSRT